MPSLPSQDIRAGAVPRQQPDALAQLTDRICVLLAVDRRAVLGPRRGASAVARARFIIMYLAHVVDGVPLSRIAHCFQRDRAAVRHALRTIEDLREDPMFDAMLTAYAAIGRRS